MGMARLAETLATVYLSKPVIPEHDADGPSPVRRRSVGADHRAAGIPETASVMARAGI